MYAVNTVDEAIELLTGKTAESVHEAVSRKLEAMAKAQRRAGDGRSTTVEVHEKAEPEQGKKPPKPPRLPN